MVVPVRAQDINWAGPALSITTYSGPTGLSSTNNAIRNGRPIGGWSSTTPFLQQVVSPGMDYDFTLATTGIMNIQSVVLTPDSGKTVWAASLTPLIGWGMKLPIGKTMVPYCRKVKVGSHKAGWLNEKVKDDFKEERGFEEGEGLPIGRMSNLEWRVASLDEHNRLMIWIVPINWLSTRVTTVSSAIMVQQAPVGFENYSDQMAFAYLRGFSPAWASPDPAVLAQAKMLDSLLNPMPQMQPQMQPQPLPQPVYQPVQQPIAVVPIPQPQPAPQPIPEKVEVCGVVVQANPCTVVTIVVNRGNEIKTWRNQDLDLSIFGKLQYAKYVRGSQIVCEADASYDAQTKTYTLDIYRGDFPSGGDQLEPL